MIKRSNARRLISLVCLFIVLMLSLTSCYVIQLGGVKSAQINENGELILEYSNGREQNIGTVAGQDGKDGADGKDGKDGKNGADGKDGENGDYEIGGSIIGSSNQAAVEIAAAKGLRSAVSINCGTQCGSGVIYEIDKSTGYALIITNYHVVYIASSKAISSNISVCLYGSEAENQKIAAEYVGGSMNYDIAVLRVRNSNVLRDSDAVAINVADADKVNVGATAIAMGNAEGMGISVTTGIVSVLSEYITMKGADNQTTVTFRVMRVDTAVNSGNSGGGLFDETGNLIGIVNSKVVDEKVENIGYAIPSSTVIAVVDNIKANCLNSTNKKVMRAKVVEVVAENPVAVLDKSTGFVTIAEDVVVKSPASGYLAKNVLFAGDIITALSINGGEIKTVTRTHHVDDAVTTLESGDTITIYYTRNKNAYSYTFSVSNACLSAIN